MNAESRELYDQTGNDVKVYIIANGFSSTGQYKERMEMHGYIKERFLSSPGSESIIFQYGGELDLRAILVRKIESVSLESRAHLDPSIRFEEVVPPASGESEWEKAEREKREEDARKKLAFAAAQLAVWRQIDKGFLPILLIDDLQIDEFGIKTIKDGALVSIEKLKQYLWASKVNGRTTT